MAYDTVIVEIGEDYVAELTLNRPEQLNAFNTPLAVDLNAALEELDADPRVRVILLKGAGKAFCAGIDLKEFEGKSTLAYQAWIERMERPLVTISRMKKPVIAQVQGVAVANGMGLAIASDLVIADENAKFGLTAIKVGLNCIGPVVAVARSVGRKRALELLLFGDLVKAPRAEQMGLINRTAANGTLDQEARQWAKELAVKSPIALQIAKKTFYEAADMTYEKAFAYMNEAFARLCSTEDAHEGVNAFLEKRDPNWQEK